MRVSELVKQLFSIMSKHGDLEVIGEVEVINPADPHELHLKSVGVSEEESQILPQILADPDNKSDTTYL